MANKQFERCLPAGIATESREFQQNLQHCGFPDTQGQGAQQHCQQEPEFEDPGTVLGFVMQDEEPGEVLGRIEAEFLKMLQGLQEGRAEISVPSLKRGVKRGFSQEDATEEPKLPVVSYSVVSLTARQGASCFRFTRLMKVLEVVHELVRTGRKAPLRDIYYQLKGSLASHLFTRPSNLGGALEVASVSMPRHLHCFPTKIKQKNQMQDVSMLLRVPRTSLGVLTSSRGVVHGPLEVQLAEGGAWADCAEGRAIPGDCAAIECYAFYTRARFVVVVEKDAVFQRLAAEGFPQATGSILVTGRGMPDFATRLFLQMLSDACPHLIFVAVVDWNPSGVNIMKTYRFGSDSSLQASAWGLPALAWLAMHACHLDDLPESAWQPLTTHDRGVLKSLRYGPVGAVPAWSQQLDFMEHNGVKAEIEAAYMHSGFGTFARDLANRLATCQFI